MPHRCGSLAGRGGGQDRASSRRQDAGSLTPRAGFDLAERLHVARACGKALQRRDHRRTRSDGDLKVPTQMSAAGDLRSRDAAPYLLSASTILRQWRVDASPLAPPRPDDYGRPIRGTVARYIRILAL